MRYRRAKRLNLRLLTFVPEQREREEQTAPEQITIAFATKALWARLAMRRECELISMREDESIPVGSGARSQLLPQPNLSNCNFEMLAPSRTSSDPSRQTRAPRFFCFSLYYSGSFLIYKEFS